MAAPSGFSKTFPLDASILAPSSSANISIDASTDANALSAILNNNRFPDGDIELGHIKLAADTGKGVSFKTGNNGGATVSFKASASVQAGVGIYGKAAAAIRALKLGDAPALQITGKAADRFLVMQWGYAVAGSLAASHPVGLLGSVSFGVDAARDAVYAIVHRFADTESANKVLGDTIHSWRLPRHVEFAGGDVNIEPGTWVVAEADASFAMKLATSLGWDMSFAREAKLLGVTHHLSAKLDASLKATFGFSVAGKYLVVVGRETAAPVVRLQLAKQSKKGLDFGFNLSVGLTGKDPELPKNFDDFIKGTFGLHGLQVLNDLREWADPTSSLGQKLAGLGEKTGLDLLQKATGLNLPAELEQARKIVSDALNRWTQLPSRLSSMLWGVIGQNNPATIKSLQSFLTALADADPKKRAAALSQALGHATFGDTPQGQFLEAIAELGLLALANDLGSVSTLAGQALHILNGGVIASLQKFINTQLNLDRIRKAVNDADFENLEQWLVTRIGNFLDKTPVLAELKDVQKAIAALDQKVAGFYKTGVQALTKRYSIDFAATYQKTTTAAALLDVNFDLSNPQAAALFEEVVAQSRMDRLLTTPTPGVTLNQATLTHQIARKGTVQLHMPQFDFSSAHVNDAMVKLTAEDHGGRVLLYQIDAKDKVTVANRAASQLSMMASVRFTGGQAQLDAGGSIAYEMRQVKKDMRPLDLEHRTAPFIQQYLGGLFGEGDSSLPSFYADLDNALTQATHNQSNHLGDVALTMQVAAPVAMLAGWFEARTDSQLRSDQMKLSRRLQAVWKQALPQLFFQDVEQYAFNESVAALLVWSSLPVSTSIGFDNGQIQQFNTDKDAFWNFPEPDLRRAIARDAHTLGALGGRLAAIQQQLQRAGRGNAAFFAPSMAGRFVELALNSTGDSFLSSLLFTEAEMVRGASKALKEIAAAVEQGGTSPTQAIKKLAEFAADLTDTFNHRVSSIYSGVSGRVLGPMLLVESSRALGTISGGGASGMLKLYALKNGHTFDLAKFVEGDFPSEKEVALTQTLVAV